MQLVISSETFKSGINKIQNVVDKKNTKPILSNFLFHAKGNQLTIFGTDLEVSSKILLDCVVNEEGKFCISAKNIADICRELPDTDIKISIDKGQNILNIDCGSLSYSLHISNIDDFPHLAFENNSNNFKMSSKLLLRILQKTTHAISSDETRYNLNGVFFQQVNSKLRAVATDGHVLALIENSDFEEANDILENGIIIPKKGIQEIKKLSDVYPNEIIDISLDESFIYCNINNSHFLSTRLIAREYPKYQAVIPSKTSYFVDVHKDELLSAVKRIKILANEKSNAIKFTLKDTGQMLISANNPAYGDAQESIDVEYSGKNISIGFNAKYLIDTFAAVEDNDIRLEFNNEFSPVVVKPSGSGDFLGIVMPLRI